MKTKKDYHLKILETSIHGDRLFAVIDGYLWNNFQQILALGLHFSRKNVICVGLSIFSSYIVVCRKKDEQRVTKLGVF